MLPILLRSSVTALYHRFTKLIYLFLLPMLVILSVIFLLGQKFSNLLTILPIEKFLLIECHNLFFQLIAQYCLSSFLRLLVRGIHHPKRRLCLLQERNQKHI